MLPKLVLIVSCLYVVQATLVVNAPADGDEGIPNKDLVTIEDNSVSFDEDAANSKSEPAIPLAAVRRCSRGPCFTSCRRRGYSGGGICIGSVCRCRAFTSRQLNLHDNNAAEIALNESGDIISGNAPAEIVSIYEEAAPQPLADCNSRSCDQTCRRIGFPGGACSNGRCKCDILRSAEPASAQEPLSEEAAPQPLSDCNSRSCDQTCRRIGFPGGACSNGRCKCDILRSQRPPLIPVPGDD